MLLSAGVYWAAWGWKFALGVVLSIYVHEMGHVQALQRYGIKATEDRKSTRLNSSHLVISYAVFCLKKKKRLAQRPRPRELQLLAPREPTTSSKRLLTAIHDAEDNEVGKRFGHALEQPARQDRRAQVPHRPREHLIKRFPLLGPEPGREPFSQGAPNLTAQLRGELLKERLGVRRQRKQHSDLSRRYRQVEATRVASSKLQEIHALPAGLIARLLHQPLSCDVRAERPAIVEKRQRD